MKGDVASAVSKKGGSACQDQEDADEGEGDDDARAAGMTRKSNGHFTTEELKDLFTLSRVRQEPVSTGYWCASVAPRGSNVNLLWRFRTLHVPLSRVSGT